MIEVNKRIRIRFQWAWEDQPKEMPSVGIKNIPRSYLKETILLLYGFVIKPLKTFAKEKRLTPAGLPTLKSREDVPLIW